MGKTRQSKIVISSKDDLSKLLHQEAKRFHMSLSQFVCVENIHCSEVLREAIKFSSDIHEWETSTTLQDMLAVLHRQHIAFGTILFYKLWMFRTAWLEHVGLHLPWQEHTCPGEDVFHYSVDSPELARMFTLLEMKWTEESSPACSLPPTPDELWGDLQIMLLDPNAPKYRELLCDIFGDPFQPVHQEASWMTWNDGCVMRIAKTIYEDGRLDRLPILADALEDAGCTNTNILNHCRNGKKHHRYCWVIVLLAERN